MSRAAVAPRRPTSRPAGGDSAVFVIALAGLSLFGAILAVAADSFELLALTAVGPAAIVFIQPRLGLFAVILIICLDPEGPLLGPLADAMFSGLPGILATPLELLVGWTAFAWLLNSGERRWPNGYILFVAVGLSLLLCLAVFRGVEQGGDFRIALWEVRAMLVSIPVIFIASGLITDRRHLSQLAAVLVAGLVILTTEFFLRYVLFIRTGDYTGSMDLAFDHSSAVLISTLVVGGLIWALWGPNKSQRLFALALAIAALAVVLITRRRAAVITAEAGIVVIALVLLFTNWRRFLLYAPIAAVACVLYLSLFWNHPGSLGQPARAFRTVFDSQQLSGRDQASDSYRMTEKLNVWWGIQANGLAGTGFGKPYAKPKPLPDLSRFWPFWDYIPHNTILWLWLKGGALAFISGMLLFGSAAMHFMHLARNAKTPLFLAAATFGGSFVVILALFAYVDLGLNNARLMTLFGALLGLIPLLGRAAVPEPVEQKQAVAPAAARYRRVHERQPGYRPA